MIVRELVRSNLFSHEDSNKSNKTKILTFQSKEVLEFLLTNKTYYAESNKSREKRDYIEDIKQLEGKNPIWGFSPIGIDTKEKDKFKKEDFLNGDLFDRFRCEMSLTNYETLNSLYLLELELNPETFKVGKTHNSYIGAVVFPVIDLNDLVAIYQLRYIDDDSDENRYYYPEVDVIAKFKTNCIFQNNFTCFKR